MALSPCNTTTDRSGRELVEHGTIAFPIACYHDDFAKVDVPWHWHQELEAAVVTEGRCVVAAGKMKYTLTAGEGIFINSEVLHGAWSIENTECRLHSLVFHSRLVGGSLDSVFQQDYIEPLLSHPSLEIAVLRPNVPWQKQALEAIENTWQLCVREPEGYHFSVRSALSRLIYLLRRNLPTAQRPSSGKALRDGERVKVMLSFIHDHYAGEISTRGIAASAMISESECLRCFRSTIGTTPIQYVKQYRIQQAAAQLVLTADPVCQIAERCGFQDMSYFAKCFRGQTGLTPTEFRRKKANL